MEIAHHDVPFVECVTQHGDVAFAAIQQLKETGMANKGRGMVRQPAIKSKNMQKKMSKNKIAANLGKKK